MNDVEDNFKLVNTLNGTSEKLESLIETLNL